MELIDDFEHSRPHDFNRMTHISLCLNLLGFEYNSDTGCFDETEFGGVDWLPEVNPALIELEQEILKRYRELGLISDKEYKYLKG